MESRRCVIEAAAPKDYSKPLMLEYSDFKLKRIRYLGCVGLIFEAKELVSFTLQYPKSIFRGLRAFDEEYSGNSPGWLCYCSCPTVRFANNGERLNPLPNKIFLVFVNEDKIIFNWRWEDMDLEAYSRKEYVPINYQTRFKERLL